MIQFVYDKVYIVKTYRYNRFQATRKVFIKKSDAQKFIDHLYKSETLLLRYSHEMIQRKVN